MAEQVLTLAEIAERLGGVLEGRGELEVTGVSGLREAVAGEISYLTLPKYVPLLKQTAAVAVLVKTDFDREAPCAIIRVEDPEAAFTEVAGWYAEPLHVPEPGVHPTAVIAEDAQLGADVHVGPYAVIESGAVIGDRTALMAHTWIGPGVQIGADCRFYPSSAVREHCEIGDRVYVHNGTVIGSDGFGYAVDGEGVRTKIPQIGKVIVADDVEIGANVAIDRARFGATRIGKGVKIDNLVMIAHNVQIEDHAVIVAQVGISGSSTVRKHAILAGQAGVAGHLEIGARAIVGAQAGVTKDVQPGTYVIGFPAMPFDKASRAQAHAMRLPHYKSKLEELEARINQLENGA